MMLTPILQFGTSRFLQAHADLFISEALTRGDAPGKITVIQSSGDPSRAARLAALADPGGYPVRIRGIRNGQGFSEDVRVTSVARTLNTVTDWPEICRIAGAEAEVILSNTSEAGWLPQVDDAAGAFRQSMSYPGKLTHLLRARFRAGGRPIQVMPTELVARNGEVLRARVLDLAGTLDAGFADWVAGQVRFVNSLVDRIVSAPIEPAGAVAEPYALWAVEDCPGLIPICRHPAVRIVPDLEPYARLKLHILNLGHTWLVEDWRNRGRPERFVREVMAEGAVRDRLLGVLEDEVLPGFVARGIDGAADYIADTLDRFGNPYLDHRLADIEQNHEAKVRHRIAAFLDWSGAAAPRLRAMVAARPAG